MDKIEIIFLGTGGAIPTISRNHSSIFLKYKESNMLIDCGEGTQRQMRKANISLSKITDILITHFHGDHFFGLPGFLNTLSQSNYNKTLNIYGPKGSSKIFNKILEIADVDLKIKFKEVKGKFIDNKYFQISAMPLDHKIPCNGYLFEDKDKLRIDKKKLKKYKFYGPEIGNLVKRKNVKLGKKIIKWNDITYLEKGRRISFIFDTKLCLNASKLARNSDLAIIEASFLEKYDKGAAEKYKHMSLEQSVDLAKKEKVKKLILTHISQRYDYKEKELLKEAVKIFKNTIIAKDLLKVEV